MVATHTLALSEDRFAPTAAPVGLPPSLCVLYVLTGALTVAADGAEQVLEANTARLTSGACALTPGPAGATLLRYELRPAGQPIAAPAGEGVTSRVVLAQPMALDRQAEHLIRCDRVDFPPGGEARPHGHRGGGIRYLIAGALEVRVGDRPGRVMRPGDAWFESGQEPVHALADAIQPTAFIRVAILPRAIRGQSSLWYVDPADAQRSTPRRYTVFIDEPIELP
jgi:quercetin dioxygenase-like cupin family protein